MNYNHIRLFFRPNSSATEIFMKNKIFNLKTNFDQASQKKLKTQTYMAKLITKMPNMGAIF